MREKILSENVEMLRSNRIVPSKLPSGYVPVDIDVTPFDNSKTKKESTTFDFQALSIPEFADSLIAKDKLCSSLQTQIL